MHRCSGTKPEHLQELNMILVNNLVASGPNGWHFRTF